MNDANITKNLNSMNNTNDLNKTKKFEINLFHDISLYLTNNMNDLNITKKRKQQE